MDQRHLLETWLEFKMTVGNFYRLQEPYPVDFTYRARHYGHPSSYAAVRFRCAPSDALAFQSAARWPEHLRPTYRALLEQAVSYGIVDGLMGGGSDLHPHRGCSLTLVEVGWDDVMSSEVAFYRATRGAMSELVAQGHWYLVPLSTTSMP